MFVQVGTLVLQILDDHKKFFDLGLVVADKLDVSVDLPPQRGNIVTAVLGNEQVFELHQC